MRLSDYSLYRHERQDRPGSTVGVNWPGQQDYEKNRCLLTTSTFLRQFLA